MQQHHWLQAFLVLMGELVKTLYVVTSSTHTTPSITLLGQKTNHEQYLANNYCGNNFDMMMIMILIAFSITVIHEIIHRSRKHK